MMVKKILSLVLLSLFLMTATHAGSVFGKKSGPVEDEELKAHQQKNGGQYGLHENSQLFKDYPAKIAELGNFRVIVELERSDKGVSVSSAEGEMDIDGLGKLSIIIPKKEVTHCSRSCAGSIQQYMRKFSPRKLCLAPLKGGIDDKKITFHWSLVLLSGVKRGGDITGKFSEFFQRPESVLAGSSSATSQNSSESKSNKYT